MSLPRLNLHLHLQFNLHLHSHLLSYSLACRRWPHLDLPEPTIGRLPHPIRRPPLSWTPSVHPIRLIHSSLPDMRSLHVQSSLVFSMNTVPTAVLPCSARAAADGEFAEQERVPFLSDFDITDPGVGHLSDELDS